MAALRSKRGASYQVIRLIGQPGWRLNISVALALEYEDVLKRKDLLPGISEELQLALTPHELRVQMARHAGSQGEPERWQAHDDVRPQCTGKPGHPRGEVVRDREGFLRRQ